MATEPPRVREFERAQLIERIERESSTVGAEIPDRIELGEEELDLAAFVFETRTRESIPPGERERVEDAKRSLRKARRERKERIEEGEIDVEEGERLADEVIGIDRALEALHDLDEPDLEAESKAAQAADKKRWMQFLKKALGRDDTDAGRAGRGRGSHGGRGR